MRTVIQIQIFRSFSWKLNIDLYILVFHINIRPSTKTPTRVLAKMSSCCPEGSEQFARQPTDYKPVGSVQTLGEDLPTYVVGDATTCKSCLLVFADVYGIESGRTMMIADELAKCGFYVVMPDFFRGDPPFKENEAMSIGFERVLSKFLYKDLKQDIEETVIPFCKGNGDRMVCALGFCYGAYLWAFAAANGVEFSACASPHPSIVAIAGGTNDDWKVVIEKINCPIMLINAETDSPEQQPGGEMDQILSKKSDLHEFHTIHKVNHGWTNRGDLSDPDVKEGTKQAFQMIVDFLSKHAK
jgi:dienelactone hydrolase